MIPAWAGLAWGVLGKFLKSIPWQVFMVLAVLWLGVHRYHVAIRNAHDAGFSEGVTATKEAFRLAQDKADTAQRAHVVKTVAAQETINKDTAHAFNVKTDSIDARAAMLGVRHASVAARRSAGQSGYPGAPGASPGASCPAPPADGLSWIVALPLMTQAAKDLAQLNAVLDWEQEQDKLDALEPDAEAPGK